MFVDFEVEFVDAKNHSDFMLKDTKGSSPRQEIWEILILWEVIPSDSKVFGICSGPATNSTYASQEYALRYAIREWEVIRGRTRTYLF